MGRGQFAAARLEPARRDGGCLTADQRGRKSLRRPFGETRARIAFSNAFWYALRALVSFFGIQVFAIEGQWGLAAHKARIHSAW